MTEIATIFEQVEKARQGIAELRIAVMIDDWDRALATMESVDELLWAVMLSLEKSLDLKIR